MSAAIGAAGTAAVGTATVAYPLPTQVVTQFSPEARKWVHPGIYTTVSDPNALDQLLAQWKIFVEREAAKLTKNSQGRVHINDIEKLTADFYNGKRVFISTEHPPGQMPWKMMPEHDDYELHNLCVDSLEENLTKGFKVDTERKFVELMRYAHSNILPPCQFDPDRKIGEFRVDRTGALIHVKKTQVRIDFEGTIVDFFKKHEPDSYAKMTAQYHKLNQLILENVPFEEMEKQLPPELIQIFLKHHVVFPACTKIESLLQKLFNDFSAKLKEGDAIAAACMLHQGITRIHPFDDANGRIARLMMNLVLMQNGHQSVGFDDESKYTKAIRIDEQAPKLNFFYKFVKGKIERPKGGSAGAPAVQVADKQKDSKAAVESQTATASKAIAVASETGVSKVEERDAIARYMKLPGVAEHEALDSQVVARRAKIDRAVEELMKPPVKPVLKIEDLD